MTKGMSRSQPGLPQHSLTSVGFIKEVNLTKRVYTNVSD